MEANDDQDPESIVLMKSSYKKYDKKNSQKKLITVRTRWDVPLESLQSVRDECLGKRKEKEEDDENMERFARQKKKIGIKIKKIREVIQQRDVFLKSQLEVEAIRYSNTARIQIADVFEDAQGLIEINDIDKKTNKKELEKDVGMKQLFSNRENIIKLIFAHIRECEFLEAQRENKEEMKNSKKKEKLFKLKERPKVQKNKEGEEFYGIVALPDIENIPDITPELGFEIQDEHDLKIDSLLDDVLKGVVDLKVYANQMKDKIELSNVMIDDLNTEVHEANNELRGVNLNLKKILKKLRSPKKLFVDICLCLLLLGLIGLIIKVVLDRNGN